MSAGHWAVVAVLTMSTLLNAGYFAPIVYRAFGGLDTPEYARLNPNRKIPVLEEREVEYLVDMFTCPSRIWGVTRGHEGILTKDGSTNTVCSTRWPSCASLRRSAIP